MGQTIMVIHAKTRDRTNPTLRGHTEALVKHIIPSSAIANMVLRIYIVCF